MGLLDHVDLMIIKGAGKTPGDTLSADVDPVVLDLWSPGSAFSLADWSPNIPSLKSGGTWADSPISDGRTLIAGVNTNVVETMVVNLTGSTLPDYAAQFKKLQLMVQDARNYWDTFYQVEPVYLRWWPNCTEGPQFSLIYNIDMDVEFQDGPQAQARITLTIEREEGWRGGVAPAGNPKQWAIENVYNQIYSINNARLTVPQIIDSQFNLVYTTGLVNRVEYSTASKQTYLTKNFIEIPANRVPGDLPALACISLRVSSSAPPGNHIFFVSRKTTRADQLVTGVDVLPQSMMLNACDMTQSVNTVVVADTGAPLSQSVGARRRSTFTPVDGLDNVRLDLTNRAMLNHRGRYAVFCRCRQGAGAQNDIQMYLAYGNQNPYPHRNTTTPVFPTLQAGAGNTTYWPVTYMGVIEIPVNTPVATYIEGTGSLYTATDWFFRLYAQRVAGVTATLHIADFVLIPIDEPSIKVITSDATTALDASIDNTGYYQHGRTDVYADAEGGSAALNATESSGQAIYLEPGVAQRLYFFSMFSDNTSDLINDGFTVGLNIVPRWSGIRDV